MTAVLVQIDAYDPVAAEAVALRAANVDDDRVCHLDGQTWWPALVAAPALRYDLFDGGFGARIGSPQSSLSLAIEAWASLPRFMLADARIRLWTGEAGGEWPSFTLRFDGRVLAQPGISRGVATIAFGVDDQWLDTPLLATYAGTTGIEGPLALKGQPKPLALGAPRYVPGQMIDAAASVIQLSGYGAIEEVEQALERLARFGAPIADHATFAALVAATVPAGQYATCKAQGLVRHGAPPAGRLSYLVKGDKAGPDGWVRLPGAVIKRIALLSGGAGKVSETSVDALDVARPWPLSVYVSQQTTARELIQRIAASVNAVAGVSWLGKLFVVPIGFGAAGVTLDASGAALPPVKSADQLEVAVPYWKLAIGAEPTWNVHPLSDVAFTAVIVPRGLYAALESYREGHQVELPNGSSWLYVNTVASSGNAPPAVGTSNSWWQQVAPPTNLAALEGEVDFGTQVGGDDKPEDGADVTKWIIGSPVKTIAFDYLGAASGLPLNLAYSLNSAAGKVSNGETWGYKVISGTVNGFTAASAEQSMTVDDGDAFLALASLGSLENKVEIRATSGTALWTFQTVLTKDVADAPPAGTGGGTMPVNFTVASGVGSTTFDVIASFSGTIPTGKTAATITAEVNFDPYSPNKSASTTVEMKLQRSIAGVWTDQGSLASAGVSVVNFEPVGATLSLAVADTGLTAEVAYDWRIVARQTSVATITSSSASGTGSVTAP